MSLIKARVYQSAGSWYTAKTDSGEIIKCRLQGKFRIKGMKNTNPVAVGDFVMLERENDLPTASIVEILPRQNYIIRQSPRNKRLQHIVASNIDLLVIVATVRWPRTSMGFIDRLLLAANMYAIDVAIVYNKKDMLREKDFERFDEIAAIYRKMDYPVHLVSAETKEGLAEISQLIEGKTVIFAGHSGVGKSTIVNQLIPGLDIKTNIISKFTSKGQHTTTVADMYDINVNTRMIDTPGIKEFAAVHIEPGELAGYFKDFVPYLENCKFSNCRHENEPNCAIKDAVVEGEITESRFMNYLKLLEEIDKPHYL